jgi:hypothetical protein
MLLEDLCNYFEEKCEKDNTHRLQVLQKLCILTIGLQLAEGYEKSCPFRIVAQDCGPVLQEEHFNTTPRPVGNHNKLPLVLKQQAENVLQLVRTVEVGGVLNHKLLEMVSKGDEYFSLPENARYSDSVLRKAAVRMREELLTNVDPNGYDLDDRKNNRTILEKYRKRLTKKDSACYSLQQLYIMFIANDREVAASFGYIGKPNAYTLIGGK